MSFSIKVSNLDNNTGWERQLTSDEYNQVKDCVKGRAVVSVICAMLKPVRTNNLKNFSKDFFLPTTLNHAIKIKNVVNGIFAILASLVFLTSLALDVVTFPVRLLTAIPRVISNSRQEKNQLYQYLIMQGVDKKLLESDHVRVKLEWEEKFLHYSTIYHHKESNVNFIEVPTYDGSNFSSGGRTG